MLLPCKSAEFMLLVPCKLVWCRFIPLSLFAPPCQLALTFREDGEMFHWSYFWPCYVISLSLCLFTWSGVMLLRLQKKRWSHNCITGIFKDVLSSSQQLMVSRKNIRKTYLEGQLRCHICVPACFNFWAVGIVRDLPGQQSRQTIWGCGSFPSRKVDLWTRSGSSKHRKSLMLLHDGFPLH